MAEYALGQSKKALDRLIDQAVFLKPITERMLRSTGIQSGMRILDIGCGVGDVTFLAAEMVGSDGHVFGLDRAIEAINVARERASDACIANVSFEVGDEVAPQWLGLT